MPKQPHDTILWSTSIVGGGPSELTVTWRRNYPDGQWKGYRGVWATGTLNECLAVQAQLHKKHWGWKDPNEVHVCVKCKTFAASAGISKCIYCYQDED